MCCIHQLRSGDSVGMSILTGALGDMTTLGASGWPCLPGVDGPVAFAPFPGLLPLIAWCD